MRNIECLTWEVTFFKGEESKPVTFSINVDRDYYNDPKDAAIDHVTTKWDMIKEHVGEGFLPKFKTFRVLNSRKLSDLAWN